MALNMKKYPAIISNIIYCYVALYFKLKIRTYDIKDKKNA